MNSFKKISFFALILLIISAVDSNRNLPSAALFGSSLIFFFLFSAVLFLLPSSLVSAELSAAFPETGGIYHWVRLAFGEKWGLLAIWFQWIQTIAWYPPILSFIAGTAAYFLDPSLIENKTYMILAIAGIFWFLTIVNLCGLRVSATLNGLFVIIGTVLPMLFLGILGLHWLLQGDPIAISFTPKAIFPHLRSWDTWTALVATMGSLQGMELAGVHINSIRNPQHTYPKAILIAGVYILMSMILGSLAIAIVIPTQQINLAGGIMQVFFSFFQKFHLEGLSLIIALLIVSGSVGGMINWIISPTKGLLNAAEFGSLPSFFTKLNHNGVATRILIAQAIIVSLLCAVLLFVPTVNAFYWFFTALSVSLYMGMYILMFCAALKLRATRTGTSFQVPFGRAGLVFCCLLGIIGSGLTIFFGFIPPPGVNVGSNLRYVLMILIGTVAFISPVFYMIFKRKKVA